MVAIRGSMMQVPQGDPRCYRVPAVTNSTRGSRVRGRTLPSPPEWETKSHKTCAIFGCPLRVDDSADQKHPGR